VHFVDDVNLIFACLGRKQYLVLDLADIIYAGVACTVDLDDIHVVALGDLPAIGAHPAGGCRGALLTVQRAGQDAGG